MKVKRIVELRAVVELFHEQNPELDTVDQLEESDWPELVTYLKAVEPLMTATNVFGGEKYPSACAVIPVLDQV